MFKAWARTKDSGFVLKDNQGQGQHPCSIIPAFVILCIAFIVILSQFGNFCLSCHRCQYNIKTSMYEHENTEVGRRIESDGYYGTIRFVGTLQKNDTAKIRQDITWLGIEWDKHSRGKHDGSYGGIQYFSTSHPSSGSFLRPEKCNFGVSFMTALISRYCGPSAATKLSEISQFEQSHVSEADSLSSDDIQQRKSNLSRLDIASLHGMFVRDGASDGDISPYVANLTDLNLSMNLLSEWSEIAVIINQMPKLKVLNISDNRLQLPDRNVIVLTDIQVLYLNRMEYSWSEVTCCALLFAHLQELHACYNRIERIENVLFSPFTEILLVNVEGNPISSWNALLPLGDLPRMQTLIANECGLTTVCFPGGTTPLDCFCALVSLSISRNEIADWQSINELNRLRSLSSLRFASNPLPCDAKAADARHTAVAKIARLQWCNGAMVTPGERHDAEMDYVRVYSPEWKHAGGNVSLDGPLDEAFIVEHPRYVELAHKYGPVEPELYEKKSSALKNNLVTVQIRSSGSGEILTKQLPVKMTIQKLKVLVQRAFKIADVSSIRLIHTVLKQPTDHSSPSQSENSEVRVSILLDNDLRELSFYSLENNAIIDVEC